MCDFLKSADLWANIIGGVVAAGLIGLGVWAKNRRKHRILGELVEILGRVIEHRLIGEHQASSFSADEEVAWIKKAEGLEIEAVAKATELSPTAGALVQWLDRLVEPWSTEVGRSVAILGTVSTRIRELLERNS